MHAQMCTALWPASPPGAPCCLEASRSLPTTAAAGVAPTGKRVRVPFIVVVKFEGAKVSSPCLCHRGLGKQPVRFASEAPSPSSPQAH